MSPASMWRISAAGPLGRRDAPPESGFTLVELLVVLVVVTLISGVLLSGFERVLDIRLRLAGFLDGMDAPTLVADWFRASVDGLLPDVDKGRDRFAGNRRRMSGLSLAALNATAGVPTRITWEVVFDAEARRSYLRYRNNEDREMTIASWPGDDGGLQYCGSNFVCHDSWPLDARSAQLPALIRLDAVKGSEPWPILAAPRGDRDPLPGQR